MIATAAISMVDSAFSSFGKVLDKIPNFDQRKKDEFKKARIILENLKLEFKEYNSQKSEDIFSQVLNGLENDINVQRSRCHIIMTAFSKEIAG